MGITFSDSSDSIVGPYAYHILRVQQNSPAQLAGLQPFFDFILAIDGQSVSSEQPHQLHRELSRRLGHPVQLTVYSSKLGGRRIVTIVPSDNWGGQGLLGASARLCSLAGEPAKSWRVLDVQLGSPAAMAGLRAGTDYIVGADTPLHCADDLCDLIESRVNHPLQLYVYCCLNDSCREVAVTPNPTWGGEGSLGCGIGYGYLHQIPCGPYNIHDQAPRLALPADVPSAPESASISKGIGAPIDSEQGIADSVTVIVA